MKLIHLSDLHYGTHDTPDMAPALEHIINNQSPDLVIISGDFTQRALPDQFAGARDFMTRLKTPCFCVPGNHDIPAYNIFDRLIDPYRLYRENITTELNPVHSMPGILIAGINSARRALPHWNWANGAISNAQIAALRSLFDPSEPRWTVCVFHHPIHKVDDMPINTAVFGKKRALSAIHDLKVDLVLTGHTHHASCVTRGDASHQSVYLSASTALSSRRRQNHENGFNVISFENDTMHIDMLRWRDGRFMTTDQFTHQRSI